MQNYSLFSLARNALTGHKNWQKAWRSAPLKEAYEVIIIGAGGHGLATAYYLAKEFGITNVAVLERGWLGGGNVARNTVTVRSNYLRDQSIPFYVKSVSLYEGLTKDLNFFLVVFDLIKFLLDLNVNCSGRFIFSKSSYKSNFFNIEL